MERRRGRALTPPQIITLGFAAVILCGALLLSLPAASRSGESIGFLDALFTATSATCVTGLVVVNTMAHWTAFGKVVILLLIQLGALGFITVLTLALLFLRQRITLRERLVIQAAFNQSSYGGMVRLVKRVVCITLAVEGVGSVLLALVFAVSGGMSPGSAIINGVFHAVSAFCNAGFDILGTESLTPYRGNVALNCIIMALIVAGGLGFTVWSDLMDTGRKLRGRALTTKITRLSLHTKLALTVTAGLIVLGAVLFTALEWSNPDTLGGLGRGEKLLAGLFQSVTLRTAGFNTIDQGELTEVSQFMACLFMLVGGSPAGTAGGMKTVTIGVILASMLSVLRGEGQISAFGRRISLDLLQKALTVVCSVCIVVLASTLLLCFFEGDSAYPHTFVDLLFESASAAGTVGISTGITPFLSRPGKLVIIFCMFLGRLSPVTVVVALNMRLHANAKATEYMEENVIVG